MINFSLFFFFFAINYGLLIDVGATRLELLHRNSPKLAEKWQIPETTMEKLIEFHRRDVLRHRMVSHRRMGLETASSATSSIAMPMNAGADYGVGEYFVHVTVGTPGQRFMLVADTGSDLTWMHCRYRCGRRCGTHKGRLNNRRVFHADRSSSFKTIPCLSEMCKVELANLFSLSKCPAPLTPCAYDYRYLEGSSAIGFFANETISVRLANGRKRKLRDVLVGCTESVQGAEESGFKGADGVLGLGFGNHTFTRKAAQYFGDKFSYCLVDHLSPKNLSNYIIFGHDKADKASCSSSLQHTDLVLGGDYGPFYGVNLSGISIGGVLLKIPSVAWNASLGGGAILESGTSLTFLTDPVYGPVTSELNKLTSRFGTSPPDGGPFEFCFNSTGYEESKMPPLRFHFSNGAIFEPPVKSYILDIAPEKKCLGFVSASFPGTCIIGNIMQQNHLWEFDLENTRLGFAPSTCT